MDNNEGLSAAVQEVTSVAEELREVRRRAEQYGQSTARLEEVSSALTQLAKSVSGMQTQFQELLTQASAGAAQIEKAQLTAEATLKTVPDVVERIERSDVTKGVEAFAASLDAVNGRIEAQLAATERLQMLLTQEREAQKRMLDDIASRSERVAGAMERIGNDVTYLRAAAEARAGQPDLLLREVQGSYAASDKAASAATVYGHRALKALEELGGKVDSMHAKLETHSIELAAIKSKRGFQL